MAASTLRTALLGAALLTATLLGACSDDASDDDDGTAPPTTAPADATAAPTTTRALAPTTETPDASVEELRVEVLERRPHDPVVFTQGLELGGGVLYETGGLYGESTVRAVDAETGEVQSTVEVGDDVFAEGITLVDDELIVLTWREGIALVLDPQTLAERTRFTYDGEGWGLCDDGERLVMSNGTDRLTFRDRTTFEPLGDVPVTLGGRPLSQLNELECVDGAVYANVWQTDTIVRIDPGTGRVTARIDASGLLDGTEAVAADVLNGVAYDAAADTFLLTGKLWPALFEVRFVPAA